MKDHLVWIILCLIIDTLDKMVKPPQSNLLFSHDRYDKVDENIVLVRIKHDIGHIQL